MVYGPWSRRFLLRRMIGPFFFFQMVVDVLCNMKQVYYELYTPTDADSIYWLVLYTILTIVNYYVFIKILRDFVFGRLYKGYLTYEWMLYYREWGKLCFCILIVVYFSATSKLPYVSTLYLGWFAWIWKLDSFAWIWKLASWNKPSKSQKKKP